jgi:hypothetical protein
MIVIVRRWHIVAPDILHLIILNCLSRIKRGLRLIASSLSRDGRQDCWMRISHDCRCLNRLSFKEIAFVVSLNKLMRRGRCIWARFRIMYQIWQAHSLINEQFMLIIMNELKRLRFIHLVKWSLT